MRHANLDKRQTRWRTREDANIKGRTEWNHEIGSRVSASFLDESYLAEFPVTVRIGVEDAGVAGFSTPHFRHAVDYSPG